MARNVPPLSADIIRNLISSDGRIAVRVTPNAKECAIQLFRDANGESLLHIHVTVPPEDGKANEAVIALLAKALGVRKSAITFVWGQTTRHKLMEIKE
jgi:uncharacterized protein